MSTKKSNTNDFIFKSLNIHGNKYNYLFVDYINSKTKVKILCPKHGEFLQKPNDHLSGYGCKKCQYEKTSRENKFTNEIFIEKAKQTHEDRFDYSLVNYNGYENKVTIICNKHGKFEQSPHNHLNGAGCPSCSESRGEKKIAEILKNNNIQFEREKIFADLKDKSNLFYDFYLPEYKLFIEYEGLQHYISIPFFGGKDGLLKTKNHDRIKYKYAVNNGYKILKIMNVSLNYLEELLTNKLKEILPLC
jgi:prepilin-type processing-associated H-X9-DG protein